MPAPDYSPGIGRQWINTGTDDTPEGENWKSVADPSWVNPNKPAKPAAQPNAANSPTAWDENGVPITVGTAHADYYEGMAKYREGMLAIEKDKAAVAKFVAEGNLALAQDAQKQLKLHEDRNDALAETLGMGHLDVAQRTQKMNETLGLANASGYMPSGAPTLTRDQFTTNAGGYMPGGAPTLERQKWEATQAQDPQSYFKYIWNAYGQKEPVLAGQPGTAVNPHSTTADQRDLGQWQNYSIPDLKRRFSAIELARLPLAALTQFSNDDLLTIGKEYPGGLDDFLKLFPKERQATFSQDIQQRLGGPPTDNAAARYEIDPGLPPPRPGLVHDNPNRGAPGALPEPGAPRMAEGTPAAPGVGMPVSGAGLPGQPHSEQDDAIKMLEQIKAERMGVAA